MRGHFWILAAIIAWGMEYILIKASAQVSALFAGVVIFTVAGILLGVTALLNKKATPINIKSSLPRIALIGLIGTGCNMLWIYGTKLTSSANASALSRTDVLFTLLLSSLVFHEKIRKAAFVFIPIMLAGIFMVAGLDARKLSFGNSGDFLILGSAFLLSLNAFIIKKYMREISGIILAFGNCLVNVFIFAVILLATESANAFAGVTADSWLLLISCVCCSFLFFVGYYASLKSLPVWEVRFLCLGVPVVAAFAGYLFLKENLTVPQAFGIAMILAGAAGILISAKNKKTKTQIPTNARELKYVEI